MIRDNLVKTQIIKVEEAILNSEGISLLKKGLSFTDINKGHYLKWWEYGKRFSRLELFHFSYDFIKIQMTLQLQFFSFPILLIWRECDVLTQTNYMFLLVVY